MNDAWKKEFNLVVDNKNGIKSVLKYKWFENISHYAYYSHQQCQQRTAIVCTSSSDFQFSLPKQKQIFFRHFKISFPDSFSKAAIKFTKIFRCNFSLCIVNWNSIDNITRIIKIQFRFSMKMQSHNFSFHCSIRFFVKQ